MLTDTRLEVRIEETTATPVAGRVELALVAAGAGVADGFAAVIGLPASAEGHGSLCRCCAGRSSLGAVVATAMRDRARGTLPFFEAVRVVVASGERPGVAESVETDRVLRGYLRLIAQPE